MVKVFFVVHLLIICEVALAVDCNYSTLRCQSCSFNDFSGDSDFDDMPQLSAANCKVEYSPW